jgi:hypothetical protein
VSRRGDELAARKQLLLARSSLYRSSVEVHALELRHSLSARRAVLAIGAMAPVRSFLFAALLRVAGRGRTARVLRVALGAIAVAKAAQVLLGSLRAGSHAASHGTRARD